MYLMKHNNQIIINLFILHLDPFLFPSSSLNNLQPYLELYGVIFVYDMRGELSRQAVEKLFMVCFFEVNNGQTECCKYSNTAFQLLLILQSVEPFTRDGIEREYSQLVQRLENRTHSTKGPVCAYLQFSYQSFFQAKDEVYSLPICSCSGELLFCNSMEQDSFSSLIQWFISESSLQSGTIFQIISSTT